MSEPKDIFRIGDVLNDTYEIRSVLGAGGMGQVFEAHDRALNRRVAIKAAWPNLPYSPIRKEAQALAAIRHPSMATVHAVGNHEGVEYVVMERVFGVSLEQYIHRKVSLGERVTIAESLSLLSAVADALAAVHRAGIAHRDVKPANIMLAPGNRVVLLDFGLFLPEFEVGGQSTIDGSPQYMAPEAIANELEPGLGHLLDLYSFGVVAYELLAGELPFGGETAEEVWDRHLYEEAPDLRKRRDDVPDRLAMLVHDLLQKDPRERPQSMEAVSWVLQGLLREGPAPHDVLSVLVVDDDPDLARVLSFYVKKAAPDAEIRTARDGNGAIEAVRQKNPDLILLDLQMPHMNGIEVCMYLRGARLAENATIVCVSAGAQEQDLELLRQLGVAESIRKGPQLSEHIAEIVRGVRARLKAQSVTGRP